METRQFAEDHNVGLTAVQDDGIVAVMVRLYALLTEALNTVRKARSGVSVGVKKAAEFVRETNDEARNTAQETAEEVRRIIFAALESCPEASLLIPDVLGEIAEEVRDVRKLVMAGLDFEDDEPDDEDVSEQLAIANFAKELLNNYSTLLGIQGHSLADLPKNMLRTNKAGETALSLPKVPSMDSDSGSPKSTGAGRPVSGGKFKFTLNGEQVPTSGFDRLAVFYCSTLTDRMNGSDLKDSIRRQTGKEWSDKGNEKFSVTVPAGTLTAELVEGN